ncbi:MAG: ABC transporter ATP-binding protein [Nitrospirota bacterium]
MLTVEGIHTFYGPIEALKGIDIKVNEGEIVCLIGSNGAGKTTTLMTISGVIKPQNGTISFMDKQIHYLPPHRVVELGISHVPEGRRIFSRLTVRENLEMGAFIWKGQENLIEETMKWVFDLFPVLKERQRQLGGTLSGGEQQVLSIGRALMSKPKMLLMDEPSLGLAPIIVNKIFRIIKDINREGVTILLVEQNANAALKLAQRGYVIETGKIVMEGNASDLLRDNRIRKAYLGES